MPIKKMRDGHIMRKVLFLVLLWPFTWPTTMHAQETAGPLSEVQLTEALKAGGLSSGDLAAIIRRRGIDFEMSVALEQRLRDAGANAVIVLALWETEQWSPPKGEPLTKDLLIALLQSGAPPPRISKWVVARKVDLDLNPSVARELPARALQINFWRWWRQTMSIKHQKRRRSIRTWGLYLIPSKESHHPGVLQGPRAELAVAHTPSAQSPESAQAERQADDFNQRKQYLEAVRLYDQLCNESNLRACSMLGYLYQHQLGVALDYPRAIALFKKSCDGGYAGGCSNLGWMYQYRLGVMQDYTRAIMLYTRACDENDPAGCNNLGVMYRDQLGAAQDYSRAAGLFSKACDSGAGVACSNLGLLHIDGRGVARDPSKAATLFDQACGAGVSDGCAALGALYRYGNGVKMDILKARQLLNKGCSMGNKFACDQLKQVQ